MRLSLIHRAALLEARGAARHHGLHARLEIRLDGAFFREEFVAFLEGRAEYSIKVPFYTWIDLQSLIRKRVFHTTSRWDGVSTENVALARTRSAKDLPLWNRGMLPR